MTSTVIDEKYHKVLVDSSVEICESMLQLTPTEVKTGIETVGTLDAEVIGTLGFTGTSSGVVVISADTASAKQICANMLFMEPEELTDNAEVADGFGEVANMITGNFKNAWVEDGNTMDLAIPSVSFGGEVSLAIGGKGGSDGYSIMLEFPNDQALRIDLRITH